MKKRVGYGARALLATLALLLGFGVAEAREWHVGVGGNNNNAGTSYATRLATIGGTGGANGKVASGDVVIVYPGNYIHAPDPVAAVDRVTYVANIGDPTKTTISQTSVTIADPNITIKGFHFLGTSVTIAATATRDSFLYNRVNGPFTVLADYTTLANNVFNGTHALVQGTMADPVMSVKFINNRFPLLGVNYTGGGNLLQFIRSDSAVFTHNWVRLRGEGFATMGYAFVRFHTRYGTWKYNYYRVDKIKNSNSTMQEINFYPFRDSSFSHTIVGDTLVTRGGGTGNVMFELNTSGNAGNEKSSHTFTIDSCFIYNEFREGLYFQGGLHKVTMRYNTVIAENSAAIAFTKNIGRNFIDHNTFVGGHPHGPVQDWGDPLKWQDVTVFTNNILYTVPASTEAMYGAQWAVTNYDSSFDAGGSSDNHLRSEWNLYASYTAATWDTLGENSIRHWVSGGNVMTSKPGSSAWSVKWCAGCDDSSSYGSPQFDQAGPDSLPRTLDPLTGEPTYLDADIGALSKARGTGGGGSDIGARAFAIYPRIATFTTQMNFVDYEGAGAQTFLLRIYNTADAAVDLNITALSFNLGGLGASPTTAVIAEGAYQDFTITFTPQEDSTRRAGYLTIASDDPLQPNYLIPINVNRTSTPGRPTIDDGGE